MSKSNSFPKLSRQPCRQPSSPSQPIQPSHPSQPSRPIDRPSSFLVSKIPSHYLSNKEQGAMMNKNPAIAKKLEQTAKHTVQRRATRDGRSNPSRFNSCVSMINHS